MRSRITRGLDRLSSRTLLRLSLHSLQHVGDVGRLALKLQAHTLLEARARVRLGGSDGDFWFMTG